MTYRLVVLLTEPSVDSESTNLQRLKVARIPIHLLQLSDKDH